MTVYCKTFYYLLIVPALLIFLAITQVGPVSAQTYFWTPPTSTGSCGGSFSSVSPFQLSKVVNRAKNPLDDGRLFAEYFGIGLSRSLKGQDVKKFKAYILGAAQSMAFTKPDFASSKWSPIYVQSNILRLNAMYIVFLQSRGMLTAGERNILIKWGDKMVPGQKGSKGNGSADSRAASGNALVAWGSVTGSKSLIKRGQRQIMEALPYVLGSVGNLKRQSTFRGVPISVISLEDEYNLTLAHVVEGAASLRNLGIDLYSVEKKGRNLHDAVDWWTGVISTRPKPFKGYSAKSHNMNVGWIPIYLYHFGNRPVASQLRTIERNVTRGRRPGFRAIALGGPTDCFW